MRNELKIESGKYYRLRIGYRVFVAVTNKPGDKPIVGWRDAGQPHEWTAGGSQCVNGAELPFDIISEWVEPERIPWEHLPNWCRWWAKDETGFESGYESKPALGRSSFTLTLVNSGVCYLPSRLNSNYTGDWRNSLRERPEGV